MTPDINRMLRARPRNCRYGAPMGDSNRHAPRLEQCPVCFGRGYRAMPHRDGRLGFRAITCSRCNGSGQSPPRLYCQRIRFVDGDYGPDGTYWGGGSRLYAVFSADLETLCYYRARTRAQALAHFAGDYPR